jgi:glutamate/tyrosine decarboxylase-like PLP-dependent enzyme
MGTKAMTPEGYRRLAAECLRVAQDVGHRTSRSTLLDMAQTWLELAHLAEKNLTTDLVYETPPPRERPVMRQQQQQQQQQQQVLPKKEGS